MTPMHAWAEKNGLCLAMLYQGRVVHIVKIIEHPTIIKELGVETLCGKSGQRKHGGHYYWGDDLEPKCQKCIEEANKRMDAPVPARADTPARVQAAGNGE